MNFRGFFLLMLLLVPSTVFGQTAQEKYQEAKAAEFRSDNSTNRNEREAYIGQAFNAISEAATADSRYIDAFVTITRKYIARRRDPYFYMVGSVERVGQKRSSNPAFKSISAEVARAYAKTILQKGFGPGKPFMQKRRDGHCNVPYDNLSNHAYVAGFTGNDWLGALRW